LQKYADNLSDSTHRYGAAIWYYALAHNEKKVKDVLDLLISLSLLHSVAYPPENEMDDHLDGLINSPKETIAGFVRTDYEAAKIVHRLLSGYATLRTFYKLRDGKDSNTLQDHATKAKAATALMAVITSSDDNIRGGLYDEERGAVVSVDFLLALLGEALVFVNQEDSVLTSQQIDTLLKAVEDIQSVPSYVYAVCKEFFDIVMNSAQGLKGSTPMDLLKKSTSSMSGSSYAMTGSSMLASQFQKSIRGSGVLSKEKVHRGWDWRTGLTAGITSQDVLKILRYGLAHDVARTSILMADGKI
jgi:hypothetical protein